MVFGRQWVWIPRLGFRAGDEVGSRGLILLQSARDSVHEHRCAARPTPPELWAMRYKRIKW